MHTAYDYLTVFRKTDLVSQKVEKRLHDASEVLRMVQCGDIGPASHIRVRRPRSLRILWWTFDYSYDHHFLVTEVKETQLTIIHYAPKRISMIILLRGVAEIIEETLIPEDKEGILDFSSGVFLVTCDCYPETHKQKTDAVKRAKRRLGERQYSVFHNNCDSFVSWTLVGNSYSHQAMNAKGLLYCIGICAKCCIKIYRTLTFIKNGVRLR
ncbi:uncharacterized protein LOC134272971 [Saccostrea cucullata]|uniref:uncharacterized protein LOC134272971 n=1 Tax=Saccostrea cuccullata TaxID=36930 RepID=UPI002ED39672